MVVVSPERFYPQVRGEADIVVVVVGIESILHDIVVVTREILPPSEEYSDIINCMCALFAIYCQ